MFGESPSLHYMIGKIAQLHDVMLGSVFSLKRRPKLCLHTYNVLSVAQNIITVLFTLGAPVNFSSI